jgi:ubiquinone/menaquinone biosynthesis C-methylase UbiE
MNHITSHGLKQHPVFASVTDAVSSFTKRRGKQAFLHKQKPNFTLLDVGCGNDSPLFCKAARPDCTYIGLDIGEYNLSARSRQLMDKFLLAKPSEFADVILTQRGSIDAVISAHNLEHCDEPDKVLHAMCDVLRPGGNLFLAFPCEQSTSFPKRAGTLNFFDGATHHNILRFIDSGDAAAGRHADRVRCPVLPSALAGRGRIHAGTAVGRSQAGPAAETDMGILGLRKHYMDA